MGSSARCAAEAWGSQSMPPRKRTGQRKLLPQDGLECAPRALVLLAGQARLREAEAVGFDDALHRLKVLLPRVGHLPEARQGGPGVEAGGDGLVPLLVEPLHEEAVEGGAVEPEEGLEPDGRGLEDGDGVNPGQEIQRLPRHPVPDPASMRM